jgi:miniconductance mechanosensitive channel
MGAIDLRTWVNQNTALALAGLLGLSILLFIFARGVIARGLVHLAGLSKNKYDDIIVRHLRPYRLAWMAPLILVYALADFFPAYQRYIEVVSLFLILWLSVVTVNSLLNAVNQVYESSKGYSGVSIQGYLDLTKILLVMVGIILSIALVTGQSPLVLLTGLGALTAVLLLIFHDTILSIIASIQIVVNDLIKEGDWLEVPSYEADGEVVNITLHAIKIRNADNTYTVIPTYRIVEVAYKNWRGVKESGGRRIQRSLSVDMVSIKFCDEAMLERLRKIDLIHDFLDARIKSIASYRMEDPDKFDSPLDGPQITNIEVFRAYIVAYLRSRPDIHQQGQPFLVRALAPGAPGLPIEVYIYTRTPEWIEYELIQAEIFDHLVAAANYFDLRIFQQPTGLDFSTVARAIMDGRGAASVSVPELYAPRREG